MAGSVRMKMAMSRLWLAVLWPLCAVSVAHAGDAADVAKRHYRLYCMGCHHADGSGSPQNDIPSMQGEVGRFLGMAAGRAYLAQVPGVLNTPLNDAETAQLLNWVVVNIGKGSVPADFRPYHANEIKQLRASVPQDIPGLRKQLVERLTMQP